MINRKKLIVFTRYPEPGKTKTRLIGVLGAQGAAEVHRQMAEHAVSVARRLRALTGIDIEIRFDGSDESRMCGWLGNDLTYAEQLGSNLGERMDNAFKDGFDQGCDRIVLMGSDCPDLTEDILNAAFLALEDHSVVVGPAADGGYYLVGLKQRVSPVFHGISWGTEAVFKETQQVLFSNGLSCAVLEQLRDVDTPADLPVWETACKTKPGGSTLSIIIPALNESVHVQEVIGIARRGFPYEIIVVDGGSRDDTMQLAAGAGAIVIQAPQGRAIQMNAGAYIARGDHLLFLHADTRLPDGYATYIRNVLSQPSVGGAFRFGIFQPFTGSGLIEWMTNFRARHFHLPYGDQAIFIRKCDFIEMGGYAPMPIMEDFEFIQRLKRRGRIVIADAPARTSGRRWRELGVIRTTLINQLVVGGYLCGIAPEKLAEFYRNLKDRCF
jgi:rSAM/selenodomain-associated transferase 2/rSAM/selenodomain-associated transferase 1